MITADEIIAIGKVTKTHGIQGELNIALDYDIDVRSLKCVIFSIDNIFIPFFPESVRSRGEGAVLVKFENIDSDALASQFVKHDVYALARELPDEIEAYIDECDGYDLGELIGFTITDNSSGFTGEITDYDNSTENVLILVTDKNGIEHTLPFAGNFVTHYDEQNKIINVKLPSGLFEL